MFGLAVELDGISNECLREHRDQGVGSGMTVIIVVFGPVKQAFWSSKATRSFGNPKYTPFR